MQQGRGKRACRAKKQKNMPKARWSKATAILSGTP
jgi:hypothetical protein